MSDKALYLTQFSRGYLPYSLAIVIHKEMEMHRKKTENVWQ